MEIRRTMVQGVRERDAAEIKWLVRKVKPGDLGRLRASSATRPGSADSPGRSRLAGRGRFDWWMMGGFTW